jgi:hypothetical protein
VESEDIRHVAGLRLRWNCSGGDREGQHSSSSSEEHSTAEQNKPKLSSSKQAEPQGATSKASS